MGARNLMSHAITVDDLPPSTAEFVRGEGRARGLADVLADVTHGLRTDEETMNRESRGGPTSDRYVVEMLLTPELLIVAHRQSDDAETDPGARVRFHPLDQLEVTLPTAGPRLAMPARSIPVTSTPLGGARRATYQLPIAIDADVDRFREALLQAAQAARA
ncbi:hypothetical protein EV188_101486 [Actinomycetospora succinea]|uniref:Uncharacterized protein n=1 Tax=Actinomycetospora succinea TaxID=663603 RepID=A0A4R6VRN7_9PSEU|nr:hypothetical protein [Actinomycetospora succinea]TDQ65236.1 hypothetical protein EV188_101486 [Actinomycetospora succinea]